jgi:hypothetical protein
MRLVASFLWRQKNTNKHVFFTWIIKEQLRDTTGNELANLVQPQSCPKAVTHDVSPQISTCAELWGPALQQQHAPQTPSSRVSPANVLRDGNTNGFCSHKLFWICPEKKKHLLLRSRK